MTIDSKIRLTIRSKDAIGGHVNASISHRPRAESSPPAVGDLSNDIQTPPGSSGVVGYVARSIVVPTAATGLIERYRPVDSAA